MCFDKVENILCKNMASHFISSKQRMGTEVKIYYNSQVNYSMLGVKIGLGQFLTMFHVWQLIIQLLKFLQWESMGCLWFYNIRDRRLFFGINTDLGINPNSIPHTDLFQGIFSQTLTQPLLLTLVQSMLLFWNSSSFHEN